MKDAEGLFSQRLGLLMMKRDRQRVGEARCGDKGEHHSRWKDVDAVVSVDVVCEKSDENINNEILGNDLRGGLGTGLKALTMRWYIWV